MKQVDNFRGVPEDKEGIGDTFLFWSDNWLLNGSSRPIKFRFPRLFSYVLEENMLACEVYSTQDMIELFYMPLSMQAFQELGEQMLMEDNPLSKQRDSLTYVWGDKYSSAQFYAHIHRHIQMPGVYKWPRKSCCTTKTKKIVVDTAKSH
jgi:hypothetical protein